VQRSLRKGDLQHMLSSVIPSSRRNSAGMVICPPLRGLIIREIRFCLQTISKITPTTYAGVYENYY
jgi:hypothetical protein